MIKYIIPEHTSAHPTILKTVLGCLIIVDNTFSLTVCTNEKERIFLEI